MSTPAERRRLAEAAAAVRAEHEAEFAQWEHHPTLRPAWLALAKISETAGSFLAWPEAQRKRILADHLPYNSRFQLTLFVLANGVSPLLYAEYLIARGSLRDFPARNHVASMIDSHKKNQLGRYTAWNVDRQATINVVVPDSFDVGGEGDVHGFYWDEAVAVLRGAFRPIASAMMPPPGAPGPSAPPRPDKVELANKWAVEARSA